MSDRELVAAYVLGELEAPELADFELRLEREPDLRREVEATWALSAGLEVLPAEAWPGAEGPGGAAAEAPPLARLLSAAPAPRRQHRRGALSAGLPSPWRPSPPRW